MEIRNFELGWNCEPVYKIIKILCVESLLFSLIGFHFLARILQRPSRPPTHMLHAFSIVGTSMCSTSANEHVLDQCHLSYVEYLSQGQYVKRVEFGNWDEYNLNPLMMIHWKAGIVPVAKVILISIDSWIYKRRITIKLLANNGLHFLVSMFDLGAFTN